MIDMQQRRIDNRRTDKRTKVVSVFCPPLAGREKKMFCRSSKLASPLLHICCLLSALTFIFSFSGCSGATGKTCHIWSATQAAACALCALPKCGSKSPGLRGIDSIDSVGELKTCETNLFLETD